MILIKFEWFFKNIWLYYFLNKLNLYQLKPKIIKILKVCKLKKFNQMIFIKILLKKRNK